MSISDEIDQHQGNRLELTWEKFKLLISHDWWLYENSIKKNADKIVNIICDFELKLHSINNKFVCLFKVLLYCDCIN